MNITIEILKNTNFEKNDEISRLQTSIEDLTSKLETKNNEFNNLEKFISISTKELGLFKTEFKSLKEHLENKNREFEAFKNELRASKNETDKYKIRCENLNKIISEKDVYIENIKMSVVIVNKTLQDYKNELEFLRKGKGNNSERK